MQKKEFKRLPTFVVPQNYALTIRPDLEKFTFLGDVVISLEVHTSTNIIKLNGLSLSITSAKYKNDLQVFEDNIKINYLKDEEIIEFTFPDSLKVGTGTLSLVYNGVLSDKLKGFYKSKYKTPSGEERFAGVTQFEPTGARQAFPCWDEPAVKATFDITLIVPVDRVAISNMPVKVESNCEADPKAKMVSFERTPVMSTYLVAFIIGEYDYVEARDSDGVLVRVYTPVGKKSQGNFALEVAIKTLPFYKEYFKVAYPLPKMDLIAISDFGGGAMENWGLLTYRETALLIDPVDSSMSSKESVTLVVGHEIAHQWFGNLVTPDWWTDLWLKEGFASWIEYLCVDHCFPEFDIWTRFACSDFSLALDLDALLNSHPIEVEVSHPSEIEEIFDSISYSKGASLIRMLHDYVGDEDFRRGMNVYLTRHAYKNTFTEDLWSALTETSGKPVAKVMEGWTKQVGYPVIKVSQENISGSSLRLTLSQERFIADGSKDDSGHIWMVPISICSASNPNVVIQKFVLDKQHATVTVDNVKSDEWVKLNVGGIGFYRTNYSADMLDALLPSIKSKALPPRDRLALQNDLFALSRAGVTSITNVLKVVKSFESEANFTVWTDLNSNLAGALLLYQNTDCHEQFKSFLRKLFTPIMKSLGWDPSENEGPLVAMLRGLVIGRLGRCGDPDVVEEARRRFKMHCTGERKLPADLRSAVYITVATHGNEEDFDVFLKMYRSSDHQEEKVRILRSLGSFTSPELIKKVLEFSMGAEVRSQDTVHTILGATGSAKGRHLVWEFIKDRWGIFFERYGTSVFLLPHLVKRATEHFDSEDYAKDIKEFFEKNPAPSVERSVKQSLENIKLNCQQVKRDLPALRKFLKSI